MTQNSRFHLNGIDSIRLREFRQLKRMKIGAHLQGTVDKIILSMIPPCLWNAPKDYAFPWRDSGRSHIWWPSLVADTGFAVAGGLRIYRSALSVGCGNIFLGDGNETRGDLWSPCRCAVQFRDRAQYHPEFWGIHAEIQGVVLNFAVLIVVSLLTKPMDREHVRSNRTWCTLVGGVCF